MILLGIESATELVGVAVAGRRRRGRARATGGRGHAESLAPAIDQVCAGRGGPGRPRGVAVDVGPGLFTGLRVGVATAKGLAQGLGIGVVGVTSLEVLAAGRPTGPARGAGCGGGGGRRPAGRGVRRPLPVGDAVVRRPGRDAVAPGRGPSTTGRAHRARGAGRELAGRRPRAGRVLAVGDGARRYADLLGGPARLDSAGRRLAGRPRRSWRRLARDAWPPGRRRAGRRRRGARLPAGGRRPDQLGPAGAATRPAPGRRARAVTSAGDVRPGRSPVVIAPMRSKDLRASWPSSRRSSPSPGPAGSSPPSSPCARAAPTGWPGTAATWSATSA